MPIERLKMSELPADERTELEAALRDPQRFHSDGREIMQAAVILPVLLTPLWFVLLNELTGPCGRDGNPFRLCAEIFDDLYLGVSLLWQAAFLEILGLILIPIAIAGIVSYGLRTRGRHGHVITGFGVVRIRGTALRLLRYADIAEIRHGSRNPPQHRIITDELDVRARDGGSIVMYGFGLEARRRLIEAHLSRVGVAR
jgi:hypothetical protein